jgi:hypothetical protein
MSRHAMAAAPRFPSIPEPPPRVKGRLADATPVRIPGLDTGRGRIGRTATSPPRHRVDLLDKGML